MLRRKGTAKFARAGYRTDPFPTHLNDNDPWELIEDHWQLIEQRAGSATTAAKRFVWSAHYLDALAVQQHDTDANGTLDRRLHATHDANFNVTAAVSIAGVAQQRFLFDAYGARSVQTADWQPTTSAPILDFGHQGGRYDLHSGLMLFRHRPLSPELMRWPTADPLGFVDGLNVYEANRSAPVAWLDPMGLATRPPAD